VGTSFIKEDARINHRIISHWEPRIGKKLWNLETNLIMSLVNIEPSLNMNLKKMLLYLNFGNYVLNGMKIKRLILM